jgi:hypothetical protein
MVGDHIAKSTGYYNRNPAERPPSHLSPLTSFGVDGASGVPTDPYCGSRARLIRYQNQLEFNLAIVEAGKSLVESTPAVSSLPRILDGFSAAVASVREG